MDFRTILEQHVASGADVTVATTPVRADVAGGVRHHGGRGRTGGSPGSWRSRPIRRCRRTLPRLPRPSCRPRWASTSSTGMCSTDALAGRRGGLRQARHPEADRDPAGPRLPPRGLLGGHRDHPRLLRGQPRPVRAAARSSTSTTRARRSTPTRAIFLPPRSSRARSSARSSPTAASSTTPHIEHSRRRGAEPDPGGRHHPRCAGHGGRLLRRPRPTAGAGRPDHGDRARTPGSSGPSWTRTPGSATTCASPPRASRQF